MDFGKINLDVIKPWITRRIYDILGIDDDVVVEFVFAELEQKVIFYYYIFYYIFICFFRYFIFYGLNIVFLYGLVFCIYFLYIFVIIIGIDDYSPTSIRRTRAEGDFFYILGFFLIL